MASQTLGQMSGILRAASAGNAPRLARRPLVVVLAALFAIGIPTILVSAAEPTSMKDHFSRTVANSWGSATGTYRYSLQGPANAFSVNGSKGIISLASNGTMHTAALPTKGRDLDVAVTFAVDRLPRAGYLYLTVLPRVVGVASHYRLLVRISPSGTVALRFAKAVDGRERTLGRTVSIDGLRVFPGKQYRARVRVVGVGPTALQAKLWSAANSQPSTWAIKRSDSAALLQTSGTVAVRLKASAWAPYVRIRAMFDNLVVSGIEAVQSTRPPDPAPESNPDSVDYLLMPRSELLGLPTSGTAWSALKGVADGSWGSPDLCDQDRKHGSMALAGALVYARTGTASYHTKVRNAIMAAMSTEQVGCYNSVLSLGRQLGSYVLAADFIKLSGSDDLSFRSWLAKIRTRELGGHGRWTSLTATHADSTNNWGAFAGASRIAASLYLGDTTDVATAAKVLRGFFGDKSAWDNFRTPSSAELAWACSSATSSFTPTNATCSRSGINLDGAIPSDVQRDGNGLTWPVGPTGIGYTLESLQGLTLQTELLYRNGYSGAWGWSDSALRRTAGLVTRNGNAGGPTWNRSSVNYHVPWLLNVRYDLDLPTRSAGFGRTFGYTDWLYGGR